jgi:hypothetical protein
MAASMFLARTSKLIASVDCAAGAICGILSDSRKTSRSENDFLARGSGSARAELGDYILWEVVTYGGWTTDERVRRFSFTPHTASTNVASLSGTACTCWQLKHPTFVVVVSV